MSGHEPASDGYVSLRNKVEVQRARTVLGLNLYDSSIGCLMIGESKDTPRNELRHECVFRIAQNRNSSRRVSHSADVKIGVPLFKKSIHQKAKCPPVRKENEPEFFIFSCVEDLLVPAPVGPEDVLVDGAVKRSLLRANRFV